MNVSIAFRRAAPAAVFFCAALVALGCAHGAAGGVPKEELHGASGGAVTPDRTDAPGGAPNLNRTDANASRAPELAAKVHAGPLVDRFVQASALFFGTTYKDGPLGEGDFGGPDVDPRVDFDAVDCVTYLEQSLALALFAGSDPAGASPASFLRTLDHVRYREGRVDFPDRNHYMMRDWVPANSWLLQDVTAQLVPGAAVAVTHTIDRAQFLRAKGVTPRPAVDDAGPLTMHVVPRESVAKVASAIRSGDLVFWAAQKDGIDIAHTGLAVRDSSGALLFRHASSKAGRVVQEPLADYAAHATFSAGLVVVRLRPDAALPPPAQPPGEGAP